MIVDCLTMTVDYFTMTADCFIMTVDYFTMTADCFIMTVDCFTMTADRFTMIIDCLTMTIDCLTMAADGLHDSWVLLGIPPFGRNDQSFLKLRRIERGWLCRPRSIPLFIPL